MAVSTKERFECRHQVSSPGVQNKLQSLIPSTLRITRPFDVAVVSFDCHQDRNCRCWMVAKKSECAEQRKKR